jgi:hypothetical protein
VRRYDVPIAADLRTTMANSKLSHARTSHCCGKNVSDCMCRGRGRHNPYLPFCDRHVVLFALPAKIVVAAALNVCMGWASIHALSGITIEK